MPASEWAAWDWRKIQEILVGDVKRDGYTRINELGAAVPQSLWEIATALGSVSTALTTAQTELDRQRTALITNDAWTGDAAVAFDTLTTQIRSMIRENNLVLTRAVKSYDELVWSAGNALNTAINAIVQLNYTGAQETKARYESLYQTWTETVVYTEGGWYPEAPRQPWFTTDAGGTVYTPSAYSDIDESLSVRARAILTTLGLAYADVNTSLTALRITPTLPPPKPPVPPGGGPPPGTQPPPPPPPPPPLPTPQLPALVGTGNPTTPPPPPLNSPNLPGPPNLPGGGSPNLPGANKPNLPGSGSPNIPGLPGSGSPNIPGLPGSGSPNIPGLPGSGSPNIPGLPGSGSPNLPGGPFVPGIVPPLAPGNPAPGIGAPGGGGLRPGAPGVPPLPADGIAPPVRSSFPSAGGSALANDLTLGRPGGGGGSPGLGSGLGGLGAGGLGAGGGLGGLGSGSALASRGAAGMAGAGMPGGGMPFMPMSPGGAGGKKDGEERERTTWLQEDRDIWGVDDEVAPGVIRGGDPGTSDEPDYVVTPGMPVPVTPAPRPTKPATSTQTYRTETGR